MRQAGRYVATQARDRGASAVEYALMVAAIAAVLVAVVFGLSGLINDTYIDTCTELEAHNPLTSPDSADC